MASWRQSLTGLFAPWRALGTNRALILRMARREVAARYRASLLGGLWTVLMPLLLLGVYAFVFGVVLEVRWGVEQQVGGYFVANLFLGLMLFALFSEAFTKSPVVVTNNVNYVKKVIFPLEVLSPVIVASSLFQFMVSVLILLGFLVVGGIMPSVHGLLLPLVIVPFLLLILGLSWLLAAIGVYLRDIAQVAGVIATAMMFLAPVFYPLSAVPDHVATLLYLNPITWVVEAARGLVMEGVLPDLKGVLAYWLVSLAIFYAGHAVFRRLRAGFADDL